MSGKVRSAVSIAAQSVFLLAAGAAYAADFQSGEVIVKYKDDAVRTRVSMNQLYDNVGVQSVRRFTGFMKGVERLILAENVKVEDAIAELEKDETVEYVQPNYILHAYPVDEESAEAVDADSSNETFGISIPCTTPGGSFPPGCASQSTVRPQLKPAPADVIPPVMDPRANQVYGVSKIGATSAWRFNRGSKQIVVGVIDTGVDYNHQDLSFNMWRNSRPSEKQDIVGYDFVHNDGLPYDDNKHGTHTAGTIGAVGGNGVGISGVAQRVSIMALKFLSGAGAGTTADAVRAIDYGIGHGARILSNSWGGKADKDNRALSDAIDRARARGVLFVAAAGNDRSNNDKPSQADFPAAFNKDNMITVAATDANDVIAKFSNIGARTVHVAAPGVSIFSTIPGDRYAVLSGTSMACPHVAGAAALVWAQNPGWNYQQVKRALLQSVDQIPGLRGKVLTGGRINVFKALQVRF